MQKVKIKGFRIKQEKNKYSNDVYTFGPLNIEDGSQSGSLRTTGAAREGNAYTIGNYAFSEGYNTQARGISSHAEGDTTSAYGDYSHSQGYNTQTIGTYSHSEGNNTRTEGEASHAQNTGTIALGNNQTVLGRYNESNSQYAVIIGNGTADNIRSNVLTIDWNGDTITKGGITTNGNIIVNSNNNIPSNIIINDGGQIVNNNGKPVYNKNLKNLVDGSAEGSLRSINSREQYSSIIVDSDIQSGNTKEDSTFTIDISSIPVDLRDSLSVFIHTSASQDMSSATDYEPINDWILDSSTPIISYIMPGNSEETEQAFFAQLKVQTDSYSLGEDSFSEGHGTKASGDWSHAEGNQTTASKHSSHAEGVGTTASGLGSHTEGYYTKTSKDYSHAEGIRTTASGLGSHAQNYNTIASSDYQTALGKYNIEDNENKYAVIIGNGEANVRSNAFTIDWNGQVKAANAIYSNNKKLSSVSILQKQTSTNGTEIGTITIDDIGTKLYCPTISFSRSLTSGTKIGTITIGGTATDLYCQTNTNTTYSAGTGISLSGTTFSNSGVRSIATGTANGTISVNTGGTTANVSVKGLGSAAYTNSNAYAPASHTHSYLPLSGGTLSGALTINGNLTVNDGKSVSLPVNTSIGYVQQSATSNSNVTSGSVVFRKRGNVVTVESNINVKQLSSRTVVATIPTGYKPCCTFYQKALNNRTVVLTHGGNIQVDPGSADTMFFNLTYVQTN